MSALFPLADTYIAFLTDAGLTAIVTENHDEALREMIRSIRTRLFATEVLAGLGKLSFAGIDLSGAKRLMKEAMAAVVQPRPGYAMVCDETAPYGGAHAPSPEWRRGIAFS